MSYALCWIACVCFVYSLMEDVGLARSHVKCHTLGMKPSNDDASLLTVFEGRSRLFCHTNVVRMVTLCKN